MNWRLSRIVEKMGLHGLCEFRTRHYVYSTTHIHTVLVCGSCIVLCQDISRRIVYTITLRYVVKKPSPSHLKRKISLTHRIGRNGTSNNRHSEQQHCSVPNSDLGKRGLALHHGEGDCYISRGVSVHVSIQESARRISIVK
jgi:hypothetical protein